MSSASDLALAQDLLRRGDLRRADEVCRRVVDAAPDDADAIHLLGLVRKQAGDFETAERCLRRSIDVAPARAEFHANLANLLRTRGRRPEAEFEYRSALQLQPDLRPARLGLARLLNEAGFHAAAEDEARQLLRASDRDAEGWSTLGASLRAQGRFDQAEAAYRRALAITPGYGAARHNLGALLGQLERAEESLAELDRAAAAGVRGPEIGFNRGRALMALGRLEAAEQAFAASTEAAPGYVEAQVALAKIRYMRGDEHFARGFESAAPAEPHNLRLRLAHGDVLRRSGDPVGAERILRELRASAGERPEIVSALAIVLNEQGRYAEACTEARAAREAKPDDPTIAQCLAGALLSLGEAADALPVIEQQRLVSPLDQNWLAFEATALRSLGRLEEYRRLYDYERFVRAFDLEAPAGWSSFDAFNAELRGALAQLHRFEAHPLDQSLRFGTQTPRSLLHEPNPLVRTFLQALDAPIREYRIAIGEDGSHPLLSRNRGAHRFAGCWSVRLRRGGYHVNHTHPEGWISSAYYAEVPPEVADTELQSGWIKFGEPFIHVPGATAEHFVQPQAGRLVLFPSYMWHGTTPIHGNAPRMTIAFDVVPA
jgi:Flp pilus assembly protein TadD